MGWNAQNPSPMASFLLLRAWCSLIILLCFTANCCKSDQNPVDIVSRAVQCFSDHYVYSSCQESYRLSAQGSINVPPEATDEYCNGPCLAETKLVLSCVDEILYNFRFYNGASIRDVRYTLYSGCGYTNKRGDFNVLERLGSDIGEYGDYDHGNELLIPTYLLIFFSCGLLFWAN